MTHDIRNYYIVAAVLVMFTQHIYCWLCHIQINFLIFKACTSRRYYKQTKLTCISTQNILSIASQIIFLLSTDFCFCAVLLSCTAGDDFSDFISRLDDGELVDELAGDVVIDKLVFACSDGDTIRKCNKYNNLTARTLI